MKKVLIIGSRDYGTKNNPKAIVKALQKSAVDVHFIKWEELFFDIEKNSVSVSVGGAEIYEMQPDIVLAIGWYKTGKDAIYRDVALSLAEYLGKHGITFWNSEMATQRSTGKLSCMVKLALEGIAVPKTLFSLNSIVLQQQIHCPVVIKAANASRGESNFLAQDSSQARGLLAEGDNTNKMLVQPFMPNNHDLRVICFAGQPELIMRRSRSSSSGSHMNNTSQGGKAEWLALSDVSPQLLTESKKICKIMNREMAGIDFIPDIHTISGYACLEVNPVPQLTSGFGTEYKLKALAESIVGQT